MVAGSLITKVGQTIAALYLNNLKNYGLGVQVSYYSRGRAPQVVWAYPVQPGEGEAPVMQLDTDLANRAWKIPAQYDAIGNVFPPEDGLVSEDYLVDTEGSTWYVSESPGAIQNLDSMNAIWQLSTERRHVHRVH